MLKISPRYGFNKVRRTTDLYHETSFSTVFAYLSFDGSPSLFIHHFLPLFFFSSLHIQLTGSSLSPRLVSKYFPIYEEHRKLINAGITFIRSYITIRFFPNYLQLFENYRNNFIPELYFRCFEFREFRDHRIFRFFFLHFSLLRPNSLYLPVKS